MLTLVTYYRRGGIQCRDLIESVLTQDARNGRSRQTTLARDLEAGHPQPPQRENHCLLGTVCSGGTPVRT